MTGTAPLPTFLVGKMLWLAALATLFVGALAGNVSAQSTNGRFATIHVVNIAQLPKADADWISRLADSQTPQDGFVWVIDLSTRNILVKPDDVSESETQGLPGALFDALSQAVAASVVTPGQSAVGSVVDALKARDPLVRVLDLVHRRFVSAEGSNSAVTVPVDIVIWADRVFVGDGIDLSQGYLPAVCFDRSSDQPAARYRSFPGFDNFETRVVLRSLDPDRAAATREAQDITLPAMFRSRTSGDPHTEVSGKVTEAASDCPRPASRHGAAPASTSASLAPDCTVALPAQPAPPSCGTLQAETQMTANPGAPSNLPAPAGTGGLQPTPAPVPATPADPAAATTGTGAVTGSGTSPVQPAVPGVPPVDAAPGDPQTPAAAPQPVQIDSPPATLPTPQKPDPGAAANPAGPAESGACAGSAGVLSLVTAGAPRFESGPGLALSLRTTLGGTSLSVERSDGNPSPLSGQTVAVASGGKGTVTRPDAMAERAVFDVYLHVPVATLCRDQVSRVEGSVALPLSSGLRVRRDFQITVAASRCADVAETHTLFLGKVEVP